MIKKTLLIIHCICLAIFLHSCSEKPIIVGGFSDKADYTVGDSILLQIRANQQLKSLTLSIYNTESEMTGKIYCEVAAVDDPLQFANKSDSTFEFSLHGVIPKMEDGLYFINNKIPFQVNQSGKEANLLIDGYTDKFSYCPSDTFNLFINSNKDSTNYLVPINDINGNYRGAVIANLFLQKDLDKLSYENGFNYKRSAKSTVPFLKSGVYLLGNKVPFLIKDNKKADIVILYSSNTENAYCKSGGKSLYSYDTVAKKHQPKVSFLRPIKLPEHSTAFLKWMSTKTQYNVAYISDKDMDDYENIKDAKLLIIPGHSEYWTRKARRNFDRFVDQGNNALVLSGNTMWWQVRYNQQKNQLICYKSAEFDPELDSLKTINWTDERLDYSVINSIGLDFNHGGYGLKKDKGWDGYKIVNPGSPLLKGSNLVLNDIIKLPSAEYDGGELSFSKDSTTVKLENSTTFHRAELIGYDLCHRVGAKNGVWLAIQRKKSSGVVVNTGSTDWCAKAGMTGESSAIIKQITLNMIDLMLQKDSDLLFSQ